MQSPERVELLHVVRPRERAVARDGVYEQGFLLARDERFKERGEILRERHLNVPVGWLP